MNFDVWCQTDVGLKRENNEDAVLYDRDRGLYIVADGMGGHKGGDVASKMATEILQKIVVQNSPKLDSFELTPADILLQGYLEASRAIYDYCHNERPELKGMGTTMVSALVHKGVCTIANVGDSRAYLYSQSQLWQLTEDHSLVNEQLKHGLITEEAAKNFVAKNVITRSVGFERDVFCDIIEKKLRPKEMLILCSDGLSGMVEDPEILEMCQTLKPAELVPEFIERAKDHGGDDNITVLVLYAKG